MPRDVRRLIDLARSGISWRRPRRALDAAWKAGLITDDERDRKRTEIIEGI